MIAYFSTMAATRSAPTVNTRMAFLLADLAEGHGFSASRLPGVKFMRSATHVPP